MYLDSYEFFIDKYPKNIYKDNMKKKITIKDIAKEAGVSVATVSYVLNNKTEERISEETRKKVLQIINLLDYTPNQSAKALATSRSQNIAVYLPQAVSPLKRAEQLYFVNRLSAAFKVHDYQLLHLTPSFNGQADSSDAIICYDIHEEEFSRLGDHTFIPLLAYESIIDDPLFFQVLSDYSKILDAAKSYFKGSNFVFASLETNNDKLNQLLWKLFPTRKIIGTLQDINSLRGLRVLTVEDTLNQLLVGECDLFYCPAIHDEKLEKLYACVELAINRVQITNHHITV